MAAFDEKLITILNHGALNLAIGIGYSLKLFDTLDQADPPLTLDELSQKSGQSRRYLKEWLGVMVTGEIIVEKCPAPDNAQTYELPKAHGDLLCRRAGANNLGVYAQEIPLLTACAFDAVKQDFSKAQGIAFSAYPQFQDFMTELADAKHESTLVQEFLPSVDNGRLVAALKKGIRVCDIGCGQGKAVHLMAKAYPNSWFLGLDSHRPAIVQARKTAYEHNLENAVFEVRDAADLERDSDLAQTFDYVCAFDAIHDLSHPLKALKGVKALLKEEGLFSMIDIKAGSQIAQNMDHPMAPFLYTVSLMHCMPVGLNDTGTGLGMMWGKEKAQKFLAQAGFSRVFVEEIPNDGFNLHFMCRP